MEATRFLTEPKSSLKQLVVTEQTLRADYIQIEEWSRPQTRNVGVMEGLPNPRDLVLQSVAVLELWLALGAVLEASLKEGARTVGEARLIFPKVNEIATATTGLDPTKTVLEHWRLVDAGRPVRSVREDEPLGSIEPMVRAARSLVAACPIDDLEGIARFEGMNLEGHRCRVAFERLQAFLSRNTQQHDPTSQLVGWLYAEGKLSVSQAAQLLGVSSSDAPFFLEKQGFCRSITAITLTDERRSHIVGRLRRVRHDQPQPTGSLVDRCVVASQRIEEVDARPWLPLPD